MKRKPARLASTVGPFGAAVAALGVLAIALRVLLMVGYSPAILYYPDERSYVSAAAGRLFGNAYRPAGYALFLRVVHVFSHNLTVTIAVQHALGMANGVLAYAIARRIGTGRWFGLLAAAIIVLSGDQLYLEHILLSDGLFLTVLLLACYCALRVRVSSAVAPSGRQVAWAAAAGALAGGLATVRTAGVAVAAVLLVWLLVAAGAGWRRRLAVTGAAATVCAVLLLGYAFAQQSETHVFGLSRFSGWPLYGRVAPFADCRQFTPPAGTAGLCQDIPASKRPGPLFYVWNRSSPANRVFGAPPRGGAKVGAFARAALLAQPGDYLFDVLRDLARYVDPRISLPNTWGGSPAGVLINYQQTGTQAVNLATIRRYYGPVTVHRDPSIVNALTTWQRIVRTHGSLIGLALLLALAGVFYTPDPETRAGLWLLLGSALAVVVASTMAAEYLYRYAIPAAAPLMVAGARGAQVIITRIRVRAASPSGSHS